MKHRCDMAMCGKPAVTQRKFYPVLGIKGRYVKLWVCQHHKELSACSTVVSVKAKD